MNPHPYSSPSPPTHHSHLLLLFTVLPMSPLTTSPAVIDEATRARLSQSRSTKLVAEMQQVGVSCPTLALSTHHVNTAYQHTLLTHPVNTPYQRTLSHAILIHLITPTITIILHRCTQVYLEPAEGGQDKGGRGGTSAGGSGASRGSQRGSRRAIGTPGGGGLSSSSSSSTLRCVKLLPLTNANYP